MIRNSKLPITCQNVIMRSMLTRIAAQRSAVLILLVALGVAGMPGGASADVILPAIQGMEVDNRPLSWLPGQELNLGSFPRNIIFNIGPETNSSPKFLRLRSKLEGIDKE